MNRYGGTPMLLFLPPCRLILVSNNHTGYARDSLTLGMLQIHARYQRDVAKGGAVLLPVPFRHRCSQCEFLKSNSRRAGIGVRQDKWPTCEGLDRPLHVGLQLV